MYYSQDIIDEVISANDIVDVIGGYVSLKKSGSSYQGLCPFHSEKTPSFSVSPGKQVFHCFGCGEGGNVITFLMKHENYSFQEALKDLADRAKIKLPEANYSEQAKARAKEKEVLLSINKDAATYYYKLLRTPKGRRGMEYFAERKLLPETLNQFGLGFADGANSDLVKHLRGIGYRDEDILKSGVAVFDEKRGLHDKFWNRVMYPIMDATNRVIGFGGRVLGDGKPKYLNSPETPVFDKSRNLYGLNLAKKSRAGYMILCEGYMDVIAMHQAGFSQAVASLGTSFTEGQALILKRYVKNVLLAYDSDGAGVKAALRNIEILRRAGLTGKVVDMRPYKDPDEFMKALGKEEFEKRLNQAENSFFYQIRQMEESFRLDDPASRTEFYHEIARKLCTFEDEIERDNYLVAIAEKYYIPVDSLRREVASYGQVYQKEEPVRVQQKNQEANTKLKPVEKALRRNERLLLTWISDKPGVYLQIRDYISAEDFEEGLYKTAAEKYFSMLENRYGDALNVSASGGDSMQSVSPASVVALFDSEEEQREAASLFETRIDGITSDREREQAFRDVLLAIKRASFEKLQSNVGDASILQKVMKSKKQLDEISRKRFEV